MKSIEPDDRHDRHYTIISTVTELSSQQKADYLHKRNLLANCAANHNTVASDPCLCMPQWATIRTGNDDAYYNVSTRIESSDPGLSQAIAKLNRRLLANARKDAPVPPDQIPRKVEQAIDTVRKTLDPTRHYFFTNTLDVVQPQKIESITGSRFLMKDVLSSVKKLIEVDADGRVSAPVAAELSKMLDGKKTGALPVKDGTSAKLYLSQTGEKTTLNKVRVLIDLSQKNTFRGHRFSEQDKAYLERFGNMGRKVELTSKKTGEVYPAYVGVNKNTGKLTELRASKITVNPRLLGVSLNETQQTMLKEGKALKLDNLTGTSGKFSAYVRIHAGLGKFAFDRIPSAAQRHLNQADRLMPRSTATAK